MSGPRRPAKRGRNSAGRPRIPIAEKKVRVSVTLSKAALYGIEVSRGKLPRSRFIESVLESSGVYTTTGVRDEKRLNGIVYTPPKLATYLASKVVGLFLKDLSSAESRLPREAEIAGPKCFRVLDPACGSGELLFAFWQQLCDQLRHTNDSGVTRLNLQPEAVLCGIDTDPMAVFKTAERIRCLSRVRSTYKQRSLHFLNTNALFPIENKSSSEGWREIFTRFGVVGGFDVIIANPPWGASVSGYKTYLEQGEFEFYQGQCDTSDLFIELALRLLKPGGYFAFIVPDSLFNQERTSLRKALLDKTQIRFIARLGERIFEKINRACALIICRKYVGDRTCETECLRLTPTIRRRILEGNMNFVDGERILSHRVPQRRFLQNRDYLFDIDVTSQEEETLRSFGNLDSRFKHFLQSTRGIELSKNGKVYQCDKCELWLPLPRASDPKCPHCGAGLSLSPTRIGCIVSADKSEGYKPLLVGENIRRYTLKSNYWIDLQKEGINYKDRSTYSSPKLLVRKTGVGMSAAIDYSASYTNQVVYIFRVRDDMQARVPLEIFLGILNSRAIYYYLAKNHGETEWRSHPYITQTQVLDLPAPNAASLGNGRRHLESQIVDLLTPYTTKNLDISAEVDAKVERIVADMYGLNRRHYQAIYAMLDSVQELLPVRALKKISIDQIFP